MTKGITPVIATILLLLIAVAIVGVAFTFFSRITQTATESVEKEAEQKTMAMSSTFSVDSVSQNTVYVRNTGSRDIPNLSFYVNGASVDYTGPLPLVPGQVSAYTLNAAQLPYGAARVSIVGGYMEMAVNTQFQSPYSISIQSVDMNRVTLNNTGSAPLTGFSFTVNGIWLNHSGPSSLAVGMSGTFYVNDSVLAAQPDPAMLNVTATGSSDQRSVCFYCNYYLGYWKFNEGSGNYANDSGSNRLNGNLTNTSLVCGNPPGSVSCPRWTAGVDGNAISFDGINDYVNLGNNSIFQLTGNISVSYWTYLNNYSAIRQTAVCKNYNGEFCIVNEPDGRIGVYHGLFDTVNYSWCYASAALENNRWFHVTVTRNSTQNIRIYKDGRSFSSCAMTYSSSNSTRAVTIGFGPQGYINGSMDEIKILNITRSMTIT